MLRHPDPTVARTAPPGASLEIEDGPVWSSPFPPHARILSGSRFRGGRRVFGIAAYRLSEQEARFVMRGPISTSSDLVSCLEAAKQAGDRLGVSRVVTQEKIGQDWLSAPHCFAALGFEILDASITYECPLDPLARRAESIESLLRLKKKVPDDVRITDLRPGWSQVRHLLEKSRLMDGFDFDSRVAQGATKPISPELSQLIWQGQVLVAILLVAPTECPEVFEVPIRFIAPHYRGTWANAFLIASCVQLGRRHGVVAIRFNANAELHAETMKLASQVGGRQIGTSMRYSARLA